MNTLRAEKRLAERLGIDSAAARLLIVGLGQTGLSAARFLQRCNIKFAIVDSRDKPPLLAELQAQMPDTPVFAGGFNEAAFNVATHILVSPGVSLEETVIAKALAKGVVLVSDIDLFACVIDAPVVGITGSNGKSTVTTMLGKMAEAAGKKVAVGGNLGIPALDLLRDDIELYVLELSSFQLERTTQLRTAAATVLNVTPDHMDRHRDLQEYAREKASIFRGDGTLVLNADDAIVAAMCVPEREVLTFGLYHAADFYVHSEADESWMMFRERRIIPLAELPLQGLHNVANALAALALGYSLGLPFAAMCKALREFKGLPHRMQRVEVINGVTWINDSKATNIGACVAALAGFRRKVVLIAGGDAKGADMRELAPTVIEKAKAVVLIGKDASLIEQALHGQVPSSSAHSIQEAVTIAARLAEPGDTVLLAPACASLDQFKNYQERGDKFAAAVRRLPR
ncbi:MAG: UDP-N-acetylmuramoyl-L-alanine--D-glutamate ligase [Gammaproteobacteria bacterium]